MVASQFEYADDARAALRAIVSDPEHGPDALCNQQTMANLLRDLLPDAPRESGVMIAAASVGLPAALRDYVTQGMEVTTAVNLGAASLARLTAFPLDACQWVAAELAFALRLANCSIPTGEGVPPGVETRSASQLPDPRPGDLIGTLIDSQTSALKPSTVLDPTPQNRLGRRRGLLAALLVVVPLAIVTAFLLGHSTGRSTTPPTHHTAVAVFWDCYGHQHTRPDRIVLACADGNLYLSGLHWSTWTAARAIARGKLGWNNCKPTCAAGSFLTTTAQVTLSAPKAGPGSRSYFSKILIKTSTRTSSLRLKPSGPYGPY